MKKYAVINAEGETIITGNDAQELKATLAKSIEDLRADAVELRRVFKGERDSFHGISDPIIAGEAFMKMMAQVSQRESWTVKEV